MTTDFPTVTATMTLDKLDKLFRQSSLHGFPVIDAEVGLLGVVTRSDLKRSENKETGVLTVADIISRQPFVVFPDQNLQEVLGATEEDYGRIPVVSRDDQRHLLGVLRRSDIIRSYRKKVRKSQD